MRVPPAKINNALRLQVFPNVKAPPEQTAEQYSECAMKGLAVKPHRGDAVAFWSLKTDGRLEPGALHGGCPVIKGEKWCVDWNQSNGVFHSKLYLTENYAAEDQAHSLHNRNALCRPAVP